VKQEKKKPAAAGETSFYLQTRPHVSFFFHTVCLPSAIAPHQPAPPSSNKPPPPPEPEAEAASGPRVYLFPAGRASRLAVLLSSSLAHSDPPPLSLYLSIALQR